MDVDDGAAGYPGGSVEDDADDDVDGHPEQGMSDGEDEEMIMLHVRSVGRRQHVMCSKLESEGQTHSMAGQSCSLCAEPELGHSRLRRCLHSQTRSSAFRRPL